MKILRMFFYNMVDSYDDNYFGKIGKEGMAKIRKIYLTLQRVIFIRKMKKVNVLKRCVEELERLMEKGWEKLDSAEYEIYVDLL